MTTRLGRATLDAMRCLSFVLFLAGGPALTAGPEAPSAPPAAPAAPAAASPAPSPDAVALEAGVKKLTAALTAEPDSVRLLSQRGDARLFLGRPAEAVADFERMIALDPAQDAPHWRLGIAYYFAGQFEKSSKQFAKYHAYDGHDRENGIWKFIADARWHDLAQARKTMLEYTAFDREPFPDLYAMFAGTKTGDEVLAALKQKGLAKDGAPEFFAHYYVGLNEALLGRRDRALALLDKAVASRWGQTAEGGPSYMWRVARLHRDTLRDAPATPASP